MNGHVRLPLAVSLVFPLAVSLVFLGGCYDTNRAFPVAEAKAAYDQVPLLSQGEYAQAREQAAQSGNFSDQLPFSTTETARRGADQSVRLGTPCDQIAFDGSSYRGRDGGVEVRLVSVFQNHMPSNDLIRETRAYQDVVADCLQGQGATVSFGTQMGQVDLTLPSEIQLYFDR